MRCEAALVGGWIWCGAVQGHDQKMGAVSFVSGVFVVDRARRGPDLF